MVQEFICHAFSLILLVLGGISRFIAQKYFLEFVVPLIQVHFCLIFGRRLCGEDGLKFIDDVQFFRNLLKKGDKQTLHERQRQRQRKVLGY